VLVYNLADLREGFERGDLRLNCFEHTPRCIRLQWFEIILDCSKVSTRTARRPWWIIDTRMPKTPGRFSPARGRPGVLRARLCDCFCFVIYQWRIIGERQEEGRKLVLRFGQELAECVECLGQKVRSWRSIVPHSAAGTLSRWSEAIVDAYLKKLPIELHDKTLLFWSRGCDSGVLARVGALGRPYEQEQKRREQIASAE
jgi:hypothetical protein